MNTPSLYRSEAFAEDLMLRPQRRARPAGLFRRALRHLQRPYAGWLFGLGLSIGSVLTLLAPTR